MKIKSLHIKNFKSIVDLTINEPNPFTVFVGPNGSGKSNIFEALEFINYNVKFNIDTVKRLYKGINTFLNQQNIEKDNRQFLVEIEFKDFSSSLQINFGEQDNYGTFSSVFPVNGLKTEYSESVSYNQFFNGYSRIFVKNLDLLKLEFKDTNSLNIACTNLENVLSRILKEKIKREEILEWLNLFLPEFESIEIYSDKVSGQNSLLVKEKYSKRTFNKELISDGTYNIIALLTAVYQSDEPQFLCIEEPENGLNPYVIRKLVDFFRNACAEKGHYIWLNTHSQTLVECLQPEEVIVVDKINGETQIKQIKGMNLHGLDMAEVWLSGALGGGTPW